MRNYVIIRSKLISKNEEKDLEKLEIDNIRFKQIYTLRDKEKRL